MQTAEAMAMYKSAASMLPPMAAEARTARRGPPAAGRPQAADETAPAPAAARPAPLPLGPVTLGAINSKLDALHMQHLIQGARTLLDAGLHEQLIRKLLPLAFPAEAPLSGEMPAVVPCKHTFTWIQK